MPDESEDALRSQSLWIRPLRRLFAEGVPPCQTVCLAIQSAPPLLAAVLSHTEGDRILLYPCMVDGEKVTFPGGKSVDLDHITLDPDRQSIHATWFRPSGKRGHQGGWRVQQVEGTGLDFCFGFVVKRSVLELQPSQIEVQFKSPPSDWARRKEELEGYIKRLQLTGLTSHPCNDHETPKGDSVALLFFRIRDEQQGIVPPPFSGLGDDQISGWPDGVLCPAAPQIVAVGTERFLIVLMTPPGELRAPAFLMLPRPNGNRKRR